MTKPRHIRIADVPVTFAPSGRPCCRWCKKEITQGTRARRWCSQACIDEYLIRASAGAARYRVEQRDHGVCALCGLDTGRISRILEKLRERAQGWFTPDWGFRDDGRQPNRALHRARWDRAVAIGKAQFGIKSGYGGYHSWPFPHLWEADHIKPVAEGGGSCGLDNLRTLCRRCHAKESGKLRRRLNAARRPQRRLPGVG